MIIFRYLAKEIFYSMFAVSLTLLVIVMSGRFVKYLAQAASGDLDSALVLSILFYRLPSFLELVLPLGLFIGILLAYGRLYVESEMTVMSACGLSTTRLALYTLVPAMAVSLAVGCLSLYASPVGIGVVQELSQNAKNSIGLETLVTGRFRIDEKNGRVTYIKNLSDNNQTMQEIFVVNQASRQGDGKELSVIFSAEGRIKLNESGDARYLVLDNGNRYVGQPGTFDFNITQFDEYGQLIKEQEKNQTVHKRTDALSSSELMKSTSLEDKATLHWRFSLAILVPIIALIAQALSKTNHRRGRYVKMLPAFLLYIFYLVVLTAARDAIGKQRLPLAWGMLAVHCTFLGLACMLLYGENWLRWMRASGVAAATNNGAHE